MPESASTTPGRARSRMNTLDSCRLAIGHLEASESVVSAARLYCLDNITCHSQRTRHAASPRDKREIRIRRITAPAGIRVQTGTPPPNSRRPSPWAPESVPGSELWPLFTQQQFADLIYPTKAVISVQISRCTYRPAAVFEKCGLTIPTTYT